jgi:Transposase DNA-binding/Transposase DDE domain
MLGQVELKDWAQAQWGGCRLGDKRRTARMVRVGQAMAGHSSSSVPKQMRDWSSIKGAYRLFAMDEVTHEAVSTPHWEETRKLARVPGLGLVLFVQDQTELDFGHKPDSFELGFVGSTYGRGVEVQTTLCLVPDPSGEDRPEVLGLALQSPWVRDHAPRKKVESGYARSKRRTEYDVWAESVEAIGAAPAPESGTTWVTVGDRGGDIFSHMWTAHKLGWRCLIRSKHDRKLGASDEQSNLHKRVRSLQSMGSTSVFIRSRPGQKSRTAHLKVSYMAASLPGTARSKERSALDVTCIRVWEEASTSTAKQPIEWILLTTLAVESVSEALKLVWLYRHRWLVEEYHKCLKTGCSIEHRNLSHRDRLLALLGVLSIVAVLLLQLKTPNQRLKPPDELTRIVRLITNAKEDLSTPSALLRRIAMLGGFIGRKADGEPGWQTIWAGWTRLQDILWGFELAGAARCG